MRKASYDLNRNHAPLLIILSGPSGAGKDVLLDKLKQLGTSLERIVTVTTRAPRPGEQDGIHYYFVSPAKYQEMRQGGELLESALVYGNWYGIPRKPVKTALENGRDTVIKVDVQGAATLKKIVTGAVFIFLATPSRAELSLRLRQRHTESSPDLARRMEEAEAEIKQASWFDYLILNRPDAIDEAASCFKAIITAEKCRVTPRKVVLPGSEK